MWLEFPSLTEVLPCHLWLTLQWEECPQLVWLLQCMTLAAYTRLDSDSVLQREPSVEARNHGRGPRKLWLAKCCKIQQLAYLYSVTYIYAQQNIFLFNSLQLYSTIRILFSYSTKLFSFNNNIYSISIAIFILLNKINYSSSVQTFYSTKIIIQLLPCIVI